MPAREAISQSQLCFVFLLKYKERQLWSKLQVRTASVGGHSGFLWFNEEKMPRLALLCLALLRTWCHSLHSIWSFVGLPLPGHAQTGWFSCLPMSLRAQLDRSLWWLGTTAAYEAHCFSVSMCFPEERSLWTPWNWGSSNDDVHHAVHLHPDAYLRSKLPTSPIIHIFVGRFNFSPSPTSP